MKCQFLLIILILLQLSCDVQSRNECYPYDYKVLPGYNLYMTSEKAATYNSIKINNLKECGYYCSQARFCQYWRTNGTDCQIFHSMKDEVYATSSSSNTVKTYIETIRDEKWTEVFFVKSGSGFNVHNAYLGIGNYTSWGPAKCTNKLCSDLFRSSLLGIWDDLPLKKVLMILMKSGKEVVTLKFSAKSTNLLSWFHMSKIVSSPWKDFQLQMPAYYVGTNLVGAPSFYAAKLHGDCQKDSGWMAVLEKHLTCNWDIKPHYPYIIYSTDEIASTWSLGHGVADALNIYVSF